MRPSVRAADRDAEKAGHLRARGRVLPAVLVGATLALSAVAAEGTRPVLAADPPAAAAPPELFGAEDSLVRQIIGVYVSNTDSKGHILIGSLGSRTLKVNCGRGCDAVGFWDGRQFRGMLRRERSGEEALGELRFRVVARESIRAELRMEPGADPAFETWVRVGGFGGESEDRSPGALPKPGDFVYVEELPEAISKVPPTYPEAARKRGIDGTVLIQVLVGRDGRIHDARIVKSIPALDAAAEAAVRQWIFKPALSKGEPVAVWVAVPIKFSLR
jgi:protein TonB